MLSVIILLLLGAAIASARHDINVIEGQELGFTLTSAGQLWKDENKLLYLTDFEKGAVYMKDTTGEVKVLIQPMNDLVGISTVVTKFTAYQPNTDYLAIFDGPYGITGDYKRNLYVSEHKGNRIRHISQATGEMNIIAGSAAGECGSSEGSDELPSMLFMLCGPRGIFYDQASNRLLVADSLNHRVVGINLSLMLAKVVAGKGTAGFVDNSPATSAMFNLPNALWADAEGDIYVADSKNNRIRIVHKNSNTVTSLRIGEKPVIITNPTSIAMDLNGNIYATSSAGDHAILHMISPVSNSITLFQINSRKHSSAQDSQIYIDKVENHILMMSGASVVSDRGAVHAHAEKKSAFKVEKEELSHILDAFVDQEAPKVLVHDSHLSAAAATTSEYPTFSPTEFSKDDSTLYPTLAPTDLETDSPSFLPTSLFTSLPSSQPSSQPTTGPVSAPSGEPTCRPTSQPSVQPTVEPTTRPTSQPSGLPTAQPSLHPTSQPSAIPSLKPSSQPTAKPTGQPTSYPSSKPSSQPIGKPTSQPTVQPTSVPTCMPSSLPSARPSSQPTSAPTLSSNTAENRLVTPANITNISWLRYSDLIADPRLAVAVSVTLSYTGGSVYCGVFSSTTINPFGSASEIIGQGFGAYVVNIPTTIVISGLLPSTSYSVYCTSVSATNNVVLSLADSSVYSAAVTTSCCRIATASLSVGTIFRNSPALGGLTVSLATKPSSDLTLQLSFVANTTTTASNATVPSLYPSSFSFSSTSSALTGTATVIGTQEGAFILQALISGGSANAFSVVFGSSQYLQIIDLDGEPPTPTLVDGKFSSDGTYVDLTFDSQTDQAGFSSIFPCFSLLSFSTIGSAVCQFTARNMIRISQSSSSKIPFLSVNATVSLKDGTSLRAYCASENTAKCSAWSTVASGTVTIATPATLQLPVVVIGGPSGIGACQNLLLDLTTSTGSAGRPWTSYSITVRRVGSSTGDADLSNWLQTTYLYSPPSSVPANLLAKGVIYAFTATLCNFLGACNTAVKTVQVTTDERVSPVVSISGSSSLSLLRSGTIEVKSTAYTQTCAGVVSYNNLKYDWQLSLLTGGNSDFNLTAVESTSQSPSTFKLSPYTLPTSASYLLKLNVSHPSGTSSASSVTINLIAGSIYAVINGGSKTYVNTDTVTTLSASSSYDQDVTGLSGATAGLSFLWTCVQTSPIYSPDCNSTLAFVGDTYKTEDAEIEPVGISAIGTVSRVTVQVYDATRSSSAYTDVTVTTEQINAISITTTPSALVSVPTNQRFSLEAQMTVVSGCNGQWAVDDSSVNLTASSLTPVSRAFSLGTFKYNLAISANALPERSSLVFSLQCGISSSSVTVTTNGSPLPGDFVVSPRIGSELSTMYSFVASDWSDPDLPITYIFSFLAPTDNAVLTAQGKSQTSYTITTLPAGKSSSNNSVTCLVQIFDTYSASVTAQDSVQVTELDSSQQQSALLSLLNSSDSGSIDAKKGALSVASSVVNRVNCTLAPDCEVLNREDCESTDHTCGPCFSAYLGDSGDKNTACFSASDIFTNPSSVPTESVVSLLSGECAVNADCGSTLKECVDGSCVFVSKSCTSDCSGHGSCYFSSLSTGSDVNQCTVDDLSCTAVCNCVDGYSGSGCNIDNADLESRRALRQSLVETLESIIASDDVTSTALVSWSSYLSSITSSPYELSTVGLELIRELAIITADNSLSSGVDYADLNGLLLSVDAILSVTASQYNAGDGAALPSNIATGIIDTLTSFADIVASSMVLGQNDVSFIYNNFRIVGTVLRAVDALNASLAVPSDGIESIIAANQTALQLLPSSSIDDETVLAATLIQVFQRSYTTAPQDSSFFSDPIRLKVVNVDNSSLSPAYYLSSITFSLKNNDALSYFTFGNNTGSNFSTTCTSSEVFSESFTCPYSGEILQHNCDGIITGTYTSFCPIVQPTCGSFNVSLAVASATSNCKLLSFTSEYTTCSCDIVSNSTGERRLLSDWRIMAVSEEQFMEDSGLLDLTTSSEYVGMDFKNTFKASSELNSADGARKALVIILLFVILWVFCLLIMVIVHYREQAIIAEEEQALAFKGVDIQKEQARRLVSNYVQSIIPAVYNKHQTVLAKLWNEVTLHHRYLYLFSPDTRRADFFDRLRHTMKVLSVETMNIFIQALLFDLQRPENDGSCDSYTSESSCLDKRTPLDHNQHYCKWDEDATSCSYHDARFSYKALLYVIIIATIVTTAFKFPLDRLLKIWACPTDRDVEAAQSVRLTNTAHAIPVDQEDKQHEQEDTLAIKKAKENRIVPHITHATQSLVSRTYLENVNSTNNSISKQVMPNGQVVVLRSKESVLGASEASHQDDVMDRDISQPKTDFSDAQQIKVKPNAVKSSAVGKNGAIHPVGEVRAGEQEVHVLCKEALELRMHMNDKAAETKLFDLQWGVDRDKDFSEIAASHHHYQAFMPEATESFRKSITETAADVEKKQPVFPLYNRASAGLELMHLFMIDLMGHRTPSAIIFRNKFNEDFEKLKVVSFWFKIACVLIVIGLNVFFIYWTLLKGVSRGLDWQLQLLYTVLIQMVIEIAVFETVECLWLHFVVPESVREDVQRALVVLQDMTEKVSFFASSDLEATGEKRHQFSAPKYFFVSNKLATIRPELIESQIVLSYHNFFPGMLCRTWPHFKTLMTRNHQHREELMRVEEEAGRSSIRNSISRRMAEAFRRGSIFYGIVSGLAYGVIYTLQSLGVLPFAVQKVVVRLLQTTVLSGLTMLWYEAVENTEYFIAIVLVIVLIVAFFVLRTIYKEEQEAMQNVKPSVDEINIKDKENEQLEFVEDDLDLDLLAGEPILVSTKNQQINMRESSGSSNKDDLFPSLMPLGVSDKITAQGQKRNDGDVDADRGSRGSRNSNESAQVRILGLETDEMLDQYIAAYRVKPTSRPVSHSGSVAPSVEDEEEKFEEDEDDVIPPERSMSHRFYAQQLEMGSENNEEKKAVEEMRPLSKLPSVLAQEIERPSSAQSSVRSRSSSSSSSDDDAKHVRSRKGSPPTDAPHHTPHAHFARPLSAPTYTAAGAGTAKHEAETAAQHMLMDEGMSDKAAPPLQRTPFSVNNFVMPAASNSNLLSPLAARTSKSPLVPAAAAKPASAARQRAVMRASPSRRGMASKEDVSMGDALGSVSVDDSKLTRGASNRNLTPTSPDLNRRKSPDRRQRSFMDLLQSAEAEGEVEAAATASALSSPKDNSGKKPF